MATGFGVDNFDTNDLTICSASTSLEMVKEIVNLSKKSGTTVVILAPHLSPRREQMCNEIIARHNSTTLLRARYLVIFNNHLPKQHFTL